MHWVPLGPVVPATSVPGRTWLSIISTEWACLCRADVKPHATVDRLPPPSAGLLMSRACVFTSRNQPVCRQEWGVQPPVLLYTPSDQVWLPHRPGAAE